MNIFALDQDQLLAAKYHNDRHVVKMILESAQLLSTAARICGDKNPMLYKATHVNHPCAIWARQSDQNYSWLFELYVQLNAEYTIRYGKTHRTFIDRTDHLMAGIEFIPRGGLTTLPLCMPDECKSSDVVASYRKYYMLHKRHIAHWKTQQPWWWE